VVRAPGTILGRNFENVRRLIGADPAEAAVYLARAVCQRCDRPFPHTLDASEPFHAPSSVERRKDIDVVESYDWKIERVTMPDGRFG
jgi:hypothetical protein